MIDDTKYSMLANSNGRRGGLYQWIEPTQFRRIPVTRRCPLCSKTYRAEQPAAAPVIGVNPSPCPDCKTVITDLADDIELRYGIPAHHATELLLGQARRHIRYQPIQYGRPWQDHVPAHARHLIKEHP